MLGPLTDIQNAPLRDLCTISRNMYPQYVQRLLRHAPDFDVSYVSRNDFLTFYLSHQQPPPSDTLITGQQLRMLEPALGPQVKAAAICQNGGSIDSRSLMAALQAACQNLGVQIDQAEVRNIVASPSGTSIDAVLTNQGHMVTAAHYVVAGGAWTRSLMPQIPIRPVKGQVLSLAPIDERYMSDRLEHVLFSPDLYIVPKKDCTEYYVGASVEEAGFTNYNTAGAIARLLNDAIQIVPAFANYQLKDFWSGLRPATPDLLPIIGMSDFENASIASGYYRNGVLLAPATAKITAAVALGETSQLSSELQHLAATFSYRRFFDSESNVVSKPPKLTETRPSTTSSPVNNTVEPSPPNGLAQDDEPEIKVWKLLDDGTQVPVYPPNHSKYGMEEEESAYSLKANGTSNDAHNSLAKRQDVSKQEDSHPGNTSNDAYDDILLKRGLGAEENTSRALAANRAFGRNKSYLETEGSPVLSISQEEALVLDKAFAQGLEDMKEFEKYFDPNDKSVLATKAEQLELDMQEQTEETFEEQRSQVASQVSSNGYF